MAESQRERERERERERDKEWTQLCHELEQAKRDYEMAEAAIAESCGTAPKKGGEAADAKDWLQESIQANLRKVDVLKRMRIFVSKLND